jgi:hypothetical protein
MPATRTDNVDADGFLKYFSRFGELPTVEGYVDLFEPTGTVQHPGMPHPLSREEIRTFITAVLALMPDFRLQPVAWCSHGEVVFVEAMTTGSARGAHAAWPAIYCVKLNGDRVVTGRSYYDRAEVFSQLQGGQTRRVEELVSSTIAGTPGTGDPARMARTEAEFISPYIEAWLAPDGRRISRFYSPTGSALVPGHGRVAWKDVVRTRVGIADAGTLRQHCEVYAACPHKAFFHWRISGSLDGRPFAVGAAERVTLDGFKIAESAIYFDTVSIEAVRDPSLASRTIFDAQK